MTGLRGMTLILLDILGPGLVIEALCQTDFKYEESVATHKSAEKRARSSETKRVHNRQYIAAVRTSVKKFRTALTEGSDAAAVQNLFKAAQSMLAKAASKGLLHRNNAARRSGQKAALVPATILRWDSSATATTTGRPLRA